MRDLRIIALIAHPFRCPRCGSRFRVDPVGIGHDQPSARLKGIAMMCSDLGMSDGAVATALACPLSKVAVCNAVQAAGTVVPLDVGPDLGGSERRAIGRDQCL